MLTIIWTCLDGSKRTTYWSSGEAQDRLAQLNKLLAGPACNPDWTAEKEAIQQALESSVYAQHD